MIWQSLIVIVATLIAPVANALEMTNSIQLQGCRATDLSDAQAFYDLVAGEVTGGRVSDIDLRIAEGVLADVKLCSGALNLVDYCRLRSANLDHIRTLYNVRGSLPAKYFSDLLAVRSRCSNI